MLRRVELVTLITEHGPVDLCLAHDGFPEGYADLSELRLSEPRVDLVSSSCHR